MFYNIAMSKNSRRALFYALLLVFFIAGTAIVLFAQGWRIDLPSLRISKVGGIYVRTYPANVSLFLNGKPIQDQSGFLSPGTLLSGLFPKNYRLAITAPGYRDWHENIAVAPALVANHEYAVLVPANPAIAASGTIARFVVGPSKLIAQNPGGHISLNGTPVGNGTLIAASPQMDALIFRGAGGATFFLPLPNGSAVNLSIPLARDGVDAENPRVTLDPLDGRSVFVLTPTKAVFVNASTGISATLAVAPSNESFVPATAAVSPGDIAWARSMNGTGSSTLVFYDPSSGNLSSTTVATDGSIVSLRWISGNTLGILTDRGNLSLYDIGNATLQHLADDVRSFSATTDGSRIAAVESRSMEIFTPHDPEGYYRFNLPDIGNTMAAIWYRDDNHLFVVYSDHVSFLDLADVGLTNFTTVATGTQASYDASTNALFLLSPDDQLLRFDFPA